MSETDVDLLHRISQDDQVAFKTLYKRHWKSCYLQILHRSGDTALAEDLTQATFVSLWERRKTAVIDNLQGYLFRTMQFKFISYLRSQVNEENYISHTLLHQSEPIAPIEASIRIKELHAAIDRGVAMMPPKTKEIYTLSRTQYYSVKEIADKLNLSEKAVEYHITKSLKTMRVALRDFLPVALLFFLF